MSYQVGERVGDYEILKVLGAGGMGKVYKVRNQISDRVEAMKVLLPNLESDPDLANRFMREIKVQASLTHPNIAALHTAQRVNNQLLMLMEYVEGVTLEELASNGALAVDKAVEYISQALSALGYAHQHGVIHRDIKPANMMLTPGGVVKLMDFGIARATADRKLTQTGHTVGSLFYMSPEQIQGAQDLDARADLYSVGITLYELVTGQRPFSGTSDYSIMAAHLQAQPVPPIQVDPRLPAVLNDIILMSIAKDPGQRFQSAEAFRGALQSLAVTGAGATMPRHAGASVPPPPVHAQPVSLPPPPPPAVVVQQQAKPSAARGLYIAIGALVAIGAIGAVATQAPKYLRTEAHTPTEATTSTTTVPPVTSTTPANPSTTTSTPPAQTSEASTPPPSGGNTPVTTAQVPTAQPVQQQQPSNTPAANSGRPTNDRPTSNKTPVVVAQQFPNSQPPIGNAPQQQPNMQPPVVQQQQPQQQPPMQAQPQVPAADLAKLEKLRERAGEVHTRLTSVDGSLRSLAQSMQAQGLSPNAVLTDTMRRAASYYNEAEQSLRRGDAAKAEEYLANAERSISFLENKLQR